MTAFIINTLLILNSINQYRSYHCTQQVQWSNDVQNSAQKWSDTLAKQNAFYHSDSNYGENLALIYDSQSLNNDKTFAVLLAMNEFYDEIKNYDYSHPGFSMITGHFTQLVWKNTIYIGVGIAKNYINNQLVITVQFNPPGNYAGQYQQNVLPLCKKPPSPIVNKFQPPLRKPPTKKRPRRIMIKPSPPPPKRRAPKKHNV